jgi:hypothetical protein
VGWNLRVAQARLNTDKRRVRVPNLMQKGIFSLATASLTPFYKQIDRFEATVICLK